MPHHDGASRPDLRHVVCTTCDLAKPGAEDIVRWARRHQGQVEIVAISVFAEFQVLRAADERTRSRERGELPALEVLNDEIDNARTSRRYFCSIRRIRRYSLNWLRCINTVDNHAKPRRFMND